MDNNIKNTGTSTATPVTSVQNGQVSESEKFLKEMGDLGILPSISFRGGEEHIIVIISDQRKEISDIHGMKIKGVEYIVDEGGIIKKFFTKSPQLISRIVEIIKTKKTKKMRIKLGNRVGPSGVRSYYEVHEVYDVKK